MSYEFVSPLVEVAFEVVENVEHFDGWAEMVARSREVSQVQTTVLPLVTSTRARVGRTGSVNIWKEGNGNTNLRHMQMIKQYNIIVVISG